MYKVGIIGATGYTGVELVRLLSQHSEVEITQLGSRSYIGQKFSDVYPGVLSIEDRLCQKMDMNAYAEENDVVFMALPHGIASKTVSKSILEKTIIIDLGADFRLKDKDVYEKWYKTEHHGEELLSESIYGLCEWNRDEIKNAKLIANPGCYTTTSILALSPLVKENIINLDSIIIDAKSGVSGAGRTSSVGFSYCEVNENFKAYKIANHRHTPEIEQELSGLAGVDIKISFTPHLVPMQRGILATCYANLSEPLEYEQIRDIFEKYYKDEFFIRILEKDVFPETRWVEGSNFYDINFKIDERTNRIIVVAALDNLIKGASGQAVQNMNIVLGLEETMGLKMPPLFPA